MKVHALLALLALTVIYARVARAGGDAGRVVAAFMCIHKYEGAWNDPGAPYYGGLQMDWTFMQTYGPEFLRAYGTADHWPPAVQMAVAMRAYLSGRGFYPWPTSARLCGLL